MRYSTKEAFKKASISILLTQVYFSDIQSSFVKGAHTLPSSLSMCHMCCCCS